MSAFYTALSIVRLFADLVPPLVTSLTLVWGCGLGLDTAHYWTAVAILVLTADVTASYGLMTSVWSEPEALPIGEACECLGCKIFRAFSHWTDLIMLWQY
jgi:hypothetical protein